MGLSRCVCVAAAVFRPLAPPLVTVAALPPPRRHRLVTPGPRGVLVLMIQCRLIGVMQLGYAFAKFGAAKAGYSSSPDEDIDILVFVTMALKSLMSDPAGFSLSSTPDVLKYMESAYNEATDYLGRASGNSGSNRRRLAQSGLSFADLSSQATAVSAAAVLANDAILANQTALVAALAANQPPSQQELRHMALGPARVAALQSSHMVAAVAALVDGTMSVQDFNAM